MSTSLLLYKMSALVLSIQTCLVYLQGGRWAKYWGSWVDLQNVNRVIDISLQTKEQRLDKWKFWRENFLIFNDLRSVRCKIRTVVGWPKANPDEYLWLRWVQNWRFINRREESKEFLKKWWFWKLIITYVFCPITI